jgi:hypothetical protein
VNCPGIAIAPVGSSIAPFPIREAILNRMLKRLLPLLVALAVAGAPVAVEACQVACTSSMTHSTQPAMNPATHDGGHSCHDGAAANGPQFSTMPHACDHSGEDQPPAPTVVAARHASSAIPLAPLTVSTVAIVAPAPALTFLPTCPPHAALPTVLRSAIPLRI